MLFHTVAPVIISQVNRLFIWATLSGVQKSEEFAQAGIMTFSHYMVGCGGKGNLFGEQNKTKCFFFFFFTHKSDKLAP